MHRFKQGQIQKKILDGHDVRGMFSVAIEILKKNLKVLNALNVFPVRDGDTGTNVLLTMRAAVAETDRVNDNAADHMADALAKGALLGAKGNSGVILSQFFRGLALSIKGKETINAIDLASALCKSRDLAYAAVGNPVEGTILTVINSIADEARQITNKKCTLSNLCSHIRVAAKNAVKNTPNLLPILRESGVVDAGGQALSLIVEGIHLYINNDYIDLSDVDDESMNELIENVTPFANAVYEGDEAFGFCTNFVVESESIQINSLREKINLHAKSVVIVGDDQLAKVHAHTENPQDILEMAEQFGDVSHIQIDNMDIQHDTVTKSQDTDNVEKIAIFAIITDKSYIKMLAELGINMIVQNHRVDLSEIRGRLESSSANKMIVFTPEDPYSEVAANIMELSKDIAVIEYNNIPEIISSSLVFHEDGSLIENVEEMRLAIERLRTVKIVRKDNMFYGYINKEKKVQHRSHETLLVKLIKALNIKDNEFLTVYCGKNIDDAAEMQLKTLIETHLPQIENQITTIKSPNFYLMLTVE